MKTKIFLSLAVFAMLYLQTNAQNVATPSNGATEMDSITSDYVTIDSRVPYFVETDDAIQAMTNASKMKASIFSWFVTSAANVKSAGVPILDYSGAASAPNYNDFRVATAGTGYTNNEISIGWTLANGFLAGTQYKIKVAEKSVTLSNSISGCVGDTVSKNVYVLARPTVAFAKTEGGGCTIKPTDDYYIELNVTGLGDWEVKWTLEYNGTGIVDTADYALTLTTPVINDANVIFESKESRTAAGTETTTPGPGTTGLKVALPAGQYGYYDVKILDISDRISRKTLTDLIPKYSGASGSFRIYVNPVPKTKQIQHVKNL
jgi:hypothetical protein